MSELHVIDHPLACANLTAMRRSDTGSADFRRHLKAVSMLVGYEATRDLPTRKVPVSTPVADAELPTLAGERFTVVAILRAGMGMVDGMLELLPDAAVGFVGMERDEATHQPRAYYQNLPSGCEESPVFVVDPMLATGGSAIDTVALLRERGCVDIRLLCVVAAPEGVAAFQAAHPDVPIYAAAVDEGLNESAYIVPGLGDAGDRIFATCD